MEAQVNFTLETHFGCLYLQSYSIQHYKINTVSCLDIQREFEIEVLLLWIERGWLKWLGDSD